MLEKVEILIVIFFLFLIFYVVISLGAGKTKKIDQSNKIKSYLSGVRFLIIILAIVALIIWLFL